MRPKRCDRIKLQSLSPYSPLCQLQSQTIDLGTHDTLARAAVKRETCPLHLLVLKLRHGFILTKVPRCEALAQEMGDMSIAFDGLLVSATASLPTSELVKWQSPNCHRWHSLEHLLLLYKYMKDTGFSSTGLMFSSLVQGVVAVWLH